MYPLGATGISYLGPDVRVVIPSCVVLWIRQAFPDLAGLYVGFSQGRLLGSL